MTGSKEVSPNNCDTNVQPEMNMAAKTGNANILRYRIDVPKFC